MLKNAQIEQTQPLHMIDSEAQSDHKTPVVRRALESDRMSKKKTNNVVLAAHCKRLQHSAKSEEMKSQRRKSPQRRSLRRPASNEQCNTSKTSLEVLLEHARSVEETAPSPEKRKRRNKITNRSQKREIRKDKKDSRIDKIINQPRHEIGTKNSIDNNPDNNVARTRSTGTKNSRSKRLYPSSSVTSGTKSRTRTRGTKELKAKRKTSERSHGVRSQRESSIPRIVKTKRTSPTKLEEKSSKIDSTSTTTAANSSANADKNAGLTIRGHFLQQAMMGYMDGNFQSELFLSQLDLRAPLDTIIEVDSDSTTDDVVVLSDLSEDEGAEVLSMTGDILDPLSSDSSLLFRHSTNDEDLFMSTDPKCLAIDYSSDLDSSSRLASTSDEFVELILQTSDDVVATSDLSTDEVAELLSLTEDLPEHLSSEPPSSVANSMHDEAVCLPMRPDFTKSDEVFELILEARTEDILENLSYELPPSPLTLPYVEVNFNNNQPEGTISTDRGDARTRKSINDHFDPSAYDCDNVIWQMFHNPGNLLACT